MTRLAALLFLLIGTATPVRAAPTLAACGLANLLPSDNALEDTLWKPNAKKCKTDRAALMTILDTYIVILDSTKTPMNSGWLGPGPIPDTLPAVVNGRLRRVLLSHPDRFAAICRNMTDLISRYDGDDGNLGDPLFRTSLFQIAVLMDKKTGGHCLPGLVAAVPRIKAGDDLIEIARGFCETRPWAVPGCKRIAR